MELLAVIIALEQLKTHNMPVRIYTDSKYVADAVEKGWLANWQRKQFKKVKNPDLWQRFLRIYTKLTDIKFNWVKGHAGNELNERADRLAVEAYKLPGLKEDTGYVQQNGTLLDG
jgi:ribonuclease HI